MHAGFCILELEYGSRGDGIVEEGDVAYTEIQGVQVKERYPYQQSLGYGAGWCSIKNENCVATASFYDRLLHLWSPTSVV